ncbi:MAG: hypothetical protein K1W41_12070 [Lachnospiraceae bacterium]
MAAEEASCAILGCGRDELSHNGDFFLLDKKTEAIRVEDVLSLLDKSSLAALGSRKVYLICHAERMNASAQNKLLKLLEDRNRTNIVILLSERDLLLETIKSRCLTIPFFPLSAGEMNGYLEAKNIPKEDIGLAGFICGSCPYHWNEVSEYFPDLKKVCREIQAISKKEDLLRVFRLVQEKDAGEFYQMHSDHYPEALSMLQYVFFSLLLSKTAAGEGRTAASGFGNLESLYTARELSAVCSEIARHQKQWLTAAYSKNDFFDLARSMVQVFS